ncbi:hypothetical protein AVEN_238513-1 [Araneus ventricosus]|uniref:Uncharacterized protein n=1 Tax=Araneus ventricosus TaxID=182803 RepID=A0A4Y2LNP7_ARAVE|nr:hypothetical protein AVEN_238513-1 [Araneus ventricosus]
MAQKDQQEFWQQILPLIPRMCGKLMISGDPKSRRTVDSGSGSVQAMIQFHHGQSNALDMLVLAWWFSGCPINADFLDYSWVKIPYIPLNFGILVKN